MTPAPDLVDDYHETSTCMQACTHAGMANVSWYTARHWRQLESALCVQNQRMCALHPNIVQLREVFLTSDYLAVAMEYADGGDLSEHIDQQYQKGVSGQPLLRWSPSCAGPLLRSCTSIDPSLPCCPAEPPCGSRGKCDVLPAL